VRPIYETAGDRAREERVVREACKSFNCEAEFQERLSSNDVVFKRVVAVGEIKTRKNEMARYPDYLLSQHKFQSLLEKARRLNVPAILVVGFTDGIYYCNLRSSYPVRTGGRVDRKDPKDVESCVFIPMTEFIPLKGEI